jgi:hypothetical protein
MRPPRVAHPSGSRIAGWRVTAVLLAGLCAPGPGPGVPVAGPLAATEPPPSTDAHAPKERPGNQPVRDASGCRSIALRAALGTPHPGDVYLRPGTVGCDQAEVEVAADAVAGVFTVSFDLTYPAGIVKYTGYTLGTLLQRAPVGTPPLCLVQESSPGTLEVTMTRFAPDHAVTAAATETLLVLKFDRVAAGMGDADFNLDPTSHVAERVVDDAGGAATARFGPGHGLKLTVYQR